MKLEFETERLVMRAPAPADAESISACFQGKDIVMMLGRAPWPYKRADAAGWIESVTKSAGEGTEYAFAITHPDHGLIGSVGMHLVQHDIWEIGYWLATAHWGQGYVTEAAQGLLDWAETEPGITRFVSGHIFDNPASGRVLVKLGFEHVGENLMYVRGRDCEVAAIRYVRDAPAEVALKQGGH